MTIKNIERKWYLIDASDKILGRLASRVAYLLMGKHKPSYTPHIDGGDFVILVNASKIRVTGDKFRSKIYYHHSGYPSGLKKITFGEMFTRNPRKVIELAVKRMLPKNKFQQKRLKRLKIYLDDKHPHTAQKSLIENYSI